MVNKLGYKDVLRRILYFFPLRLLVLHFKKNHLLLLCWLILFGYVYGFVAANYGLPYLILAPEYLGKVGFLSFFITGLALGGFITAFNLYSYALHAFRFPFIATVAKPFAKFSLNNGIIPLVFIVAYMSQSIDVQVNHELIPTGKAITNLSAFVFGIAAFIALSYFYFTFTNTNIIKLLGTDVPEPDESARKKVKQSKWFNVKTEDNSWHVETYLSKFHRIALARSTSHYKAETIRKVLWQHHVNGSIFEVLLIMTFLALGAFSGLKLFVIPAGASVFMLFTMFLMLIAALFSWLKGWTLSVLFILFIGINQLTKNEGDLFYESWALGLSYENRERPYNAEAVLALSNDIETQAADKQRMIGSLEKWKAKNQQIQQQDKPKMVLITVSGGGARSMLWTYRNLQLVDSLLGYDLMNRTAFITGSSGGLISAAYYRQVWFDGLQNGQHNTHSTSHLDAVAKDMLNPVSYALATNDLFVRYRSVQDNNRSYTFDRGIAFEERLHDNLGGVLDVRLADMVEAETNAEVPLLLITPTCINDGRSVLISSSPVSYLAGNSVEASLGSEYLPGSVEYSELLKGCDPLATKLSSALRMNATFPYIMPMVSLPTNPPMKIMDSGIRDNYGVDQTLNFMYAFREWIAENTSGVVLMQIRDQRKGFMRNGNDGSLLKRLFKPLGNVTGNMLRIQDMRHDMQLDKVDTWTEFPVHHVSLALDHDKQEEISLSWHLTAVEKERVLAEAYSEQNKVQLARLQGLFNARPKNGLLGDKQ